MLGADGHYIETGGSIVIPLQADRATVVAFGIMRHRIADPRMHPVGACSHLEGGVSIGEWVVMGEGQPRGVAPTRDAGIHVGAGPRACPCSPPPGLRFASVGGVGFWVVAGIPAKGNHGVALTRDAGIRVGAGAGACPCSPPPGLRFASVGGVGSGSWPGFPGTGQPQGVAPTRDASPVGAGPRACPCCRSRGWGETARSHSRPDGRQEAPCLC